VHFLVNKILPLSLRSLYCRPHGNAEDAYYVRHVCETTKSFSKRLNYTGKKGRSQARLEYVPMFPDERNKKWTRVTEFLVKVLLYLCQISECNNLCKSFVKEC